jgi:hypothetical protein
MNKKIYLPIISIILSSCAAYGEKESNILKQSAIKDAKKASAEIHAKYLSCYALTDHQKELCHKKISKKYNHFEGYSSWHYIVSYIHESEKLGFKNFLNNKGKDCNQITKGPIFKSEEKGYSVKCDDGNSYKMRFNYKSSEWFVL